MIFDNFDFEALRDPGYLEDSVREDIVAPLLRELGYTPSGPYAMKRSKPLVHPFVKIGSKDHKVNIIPDYTLYVDDIPMAILDAKKPDEPLINSGHVEQAYSYAIHPEVRCRIYGLCNGRQLVMYDISRWDPILNVEIKDIGNKWREVNEVLHPEYLNKPWKKGFMADLGLALHRLGSSDPAYIFPGYFIRDIMKVEDDLFTASTTSEQSGQDLFVSFDFPKSILMNLLDPIDKTISSAILDSLARQPFRIDLNGKLVATVETTMGEVTKGAYEEFVPFIVRKVIDARWNSSIDIPPITDA